MLHPAGQRYSRSRVMQRQAAIESRGFEQPLQVAAAVRHPVSSFLPRGDLAESAPLRFRLHCGNNDSAWPGDGPAMLMISLPSPATEPASSVTSEWRLSCRIPSPGFLADHAARLALGTFVNTGGHTGCRRRRRRNVGERGATCGGSGAERGYGVKRESWSLRTPQPLKNVFWSVARGHPWSPSTRNSMKTW